MSIIGEIDKFVVHVSKISITKLLLMIMLLLAFALIISLFVSPLLNFLN